MGISVFNEYGVVKDVDVEEFDEELALNARAIFKSLADMGVPPIELRAVCQFLVSTIETEMCQALLTYQMNLHTAKVKRDEPRKTKCMDDSCDADHCPKCGGHKLGWHEPGLCQTCIEQVGP